MNEIARLQPPFTAPARFTVDEFMQFAAIAHGHGFKLELEDGTLVRMSPATNRHMIVLRLLYIELAEVFKGNPSRLVVKPELTLRFPPATIRDVGIGVLEEFDFEGDYIDTSTVLLAIEVSVTSLDYDLREKARDYARAGIPNYWVVDVDDRRVHVLTTPVNGDYAERRLIPFGQPLPVPATDRTITVG